ncbi:MAG: hypothetical protein CMP62_02055 [Flavobacteriales bacterium]|nr:hypothetical protein [Flavobacteriales bacterium]
MLSNLIGIKLKNRMKLIEKDIQNPIQCQQNIMNKNIALAKDTMFGNKYNFQQIKTYNDFSKIPLSNYNDLRHYVEYAQNNKPDILWPGKTNWFAKSSGTTSNKSKFIPVTKESLELGHFKAGKDMLSLYLNNNPNSKILTGKSLMVGGSTNINKHKNSYSGDLSGIIIKNLPFWVQWKRSPSMQTALLENWDKKIKNIIQETKNKNITSISGVPSWTIIIINQLLKTMNLNCLREVWPNLELYMHGGISFANYQHSFKNYINTGEINYLELYNASEGFFGTQCENKNSDLLLFINHGIFYELIPIENECEKEDKIIPLEGAKTNTLYSIVISTNGGLWRYKIGDTIIFTSLKPYKIKIIGRTQSFINAFGEELHEDVANKGIQHACNNTQSIICEYTAGPLFFTDKSGCHEWYIEFKKPPRDINKFILSLDNKLKKLNSDYAAKREDDILLKKPKIKIMKENFFYDFLRNNRKLGGQNKIQRLHNNRNFLSKLI